MARESAAPSFVVEDHGEPVLENDETPSSPESTPAGPAAPVSTSPEQVVLEETWSPAEAQAFLHNIWNLGFWFYGVDWLAQPFDFQRSSNDAAWILDKLLPKAMGGPVGWTIHLSSIAADVGMSVGMRRELIKRGPQSPQKNMSELMTRFGVEEKKPSTGEPREEPMPAAAAPPPAKKEKPQPIATQDGDHFAFSDDVRAALDNFPDGQATAERYTT